MTTQLETILRSFTVICALLAAILLVGTERVNAGGLTGLPDPPVLTIKQRADQLVAMTKAGYHTALFSTTPKEKFSFAAGTKAALDSTIPKGKFAFASGSRVAADPMPCSPICKLAALISPPDLTTILHAQPSTVNGTTPMSLVVNIYELNLAPTTGLITVYITKDPLLSLTFNPSLTTLGGYSVLNSNWSFDALSNPDAYVLTTTQTTGVGSKLSVGLSGLLTPGNTKGNLTISALVEGSAVGEVQVLNNTDAEKIDYFRK